MQITVLSGFFVLIASIPACISMARCLINYVQGKLYICVHSRETLCITRVHMNVHMNDTIPYPNITQDLHKMTVHTSPYILSSILLPPHHPHPQANTAQYKYRSKYSTNVQTVQTSTSRKRRHQPAGGENEGQQGQT
jgi:hypothetical protein